MSVFTERQLPFELELAMSGQPWRDWVRVPAAIATRGTAWYDMNGSGWDSTIPAWGVSETLKISSDNAADTNVAVIVYGYDQNNEFQIQTGGTDRFNGQTKSIILGSWSRVLHVEFNPANVSNHVGQIFVYKDTAIVAGVPTDKTAIRANLVPGYGASARGLISVIPGRKATLRSVEITQNGLNAGEVRIMKREYGDTVWSRIGPVFSPFGTDELYVEPYIEIESGWDVKLQGRRQPGATGDVLIYGACEVVWK